MNRSAARQVGVRALIAAAVSLASLTGTRPAQADDAAPVIVVPRDRDTTYGRVEGDLGLVLGVGAAFGPRSPRAAVDLRARYLDTAGLFVTYEDGALFGSGADPTRVLAGGVELRPLFLSRWLTGREFGVSRLDLLVDSFGLELGAYLSQPSGGSFGQRPGLQIGLGLEAPLGTRATGVWIGLHGGVRWADTVLNGGPVSGPSDRAAFLAVTLAWHQILGVHAVDVGDRRVR